MRAKVRRVAIAMDVRSGLAVFRGWGIRRGRERSRRGSRECPRLSHAKW